MSLGESSRGGKIGWRDVMMYIQGKCRVKGHKGEKNKQSWKPSDPELFSPSDTYVLILKKGFVDQVQVGGVIRFQVLEPIWELIQNKKRDFVD